jgi:diguanylate cyclase
LIPGHDREAFQSLLDAAVSADMVAQLLARYGLDTRSRSALRACFRHGADAQATSRRADELHATLTESDPHSTADGAALRRFLYLYAAMPDEDFDADWLERLVAAWARLRQSGCAADLPLRAAQALVVVGSHQLLAGRSSLSALEVEIIAALSAAGMCITEFLARAARRDSTATLIDGGAGPGDGDMLTGQLAAALNQADGTVVGLLSLRLRLGSGALTLGRAHRDALVDAAMERIRGVLREADVIIRTELHACAVILPNLQTHAQVQLAAAKVAQALDHALQVDGTVVRAVFALGAVWAPDHGRQAEGLIRCADIATETARREGKSVVLFDDRMLAAARREALIEKEFIGAMDNGQLAIHVQPQVDLGSGNCIGGEMLLRWTDSEGNAVPASLIPEMALRIGAAPQLTRWLIFGACRIQSELIKAGVEMQLSVNLMASDLMDQELPLLVEQAIKFWRIPPERLMFELIESAVLEDPALGAAVMHRLIELGVSTSIDDFGIGYSSILYLRRLPLDELKVDRVFVDAMCQSMEDQEIVAALIRLAHGLGLHVVAEGVENEETMTLLREMGCDRAQGYWISKAMPAADLPGWVADWNRRAAANPLFQSLASNP